MRNLRTIVAALASLVSFSVPCALAQTSLTWKFVTGQAYEVERVVSQKQSVEVKSKAIKQERRSVWNVRLEVQDMRGADHQIKAILTQVQHQVVGASPREMFDSKLGEKMSGSVFTLLVTPGGHVREMKGYAEFLDRLARTDKNELPATRRKALRISLPEEAIQGAFADIFGPLPERPVARQDTWERAQVEPIPHFGNFRSRIRHQYQGKVNDRDRISYTMRTEYEVPRDETMVLFRIAKGTIQTERAGGTIQFAGGMVTEHERTMFLQGTLTIEAMNQQQVLDFTSASEMKLRVKSVQ